MKTKIKNILLLLSLVAILILPYFVFAQAPLTGLQAIQKGSGFAEVGEGATGNNLAANLGKIVTVIFSLLGVIFLILMIYAGISWMTAAGDQGKVEKAQGTIRRAIIGLIVAVGAYAITAFVLAKVLA